MTDPSKTDPMSANSPEEPVEQGRSLTGLIVVLAIVGAAMLAMGAQTLGEPPTSPDVRMGLSVPAPPAAEGTPITVAKPASKIARPVRALPRSEPVTLEIPSIEVSTQVANVGLKPDGTVEVPALEEDAPAGWYRYLATPGEQGPAVILGHVDSAQDGPAVFYRLGQVRRGDDVKVTRADGSVAVFTVRSVNQIPKSEFPTDAVYGPTNSAELRLVTCGGPFDRGRSSYRDNIIVFATLQSVTNRPETGL